MNMAVIEITNLTKDYEVGFWRKRKVRALDGLSLAVDPGQIFGFLGANGAGKTTTLKLLMRLIFPTTGSARILGHDIQDVSMYQRIGYLPENPYFYDYLTAREFRLLEFLMRSAGRICGRMSIIEKVWDYDFDPGTNLVDVYVKRLREKIDEGFEPKLLHTVRGVGYVLKE